jgi:hypothetical protein
MYVTEVPDHIADAGQWLHDERAVARPAHRRRGQSLQAL